MTRHPTKQSAGRGMVLIAVLWVVAALSLIVTGMVRSVRDELRQVGVSDQMVRGAALGDAAVALVLQRMSDPTWVQLPYGSLEISFLEHTIKVQIASLTGWIDLNTASPVLLQKLFVVAAGLPADQAGAVAATVVAMRSRTEPSGRLTRFEATEDLMQVEGVDYEIYSKVAPLLTTDARGSGRVAAVAAPPGVLEVLADGNQAVVQRIVSARDANAVGLDTTGLDPTLVDNATSRRYLIRAQVPLNDGAWVIASRWVDFSDQRSDGLPWRVFHADNRFEQKPD
jgi:general secretion pathway protein K